MESQPSEAESTLREATFLLQISQYLFMRRFGSGPVAGPAPDPKPCSTLTPALLTVPPSQASVQLSATVLTRCQSQ